LRKNEKINFNEIVKRTKEAASGNHDIVLVEGVGGLLAPISSKNTMASFAKEIESHLIIVAQNRVGVINHVLLSVEAAVSRGLSVSSVILMRQEESDASVADNAELIRMHMPNITNFKGIYDFPWLGEGADNPKLISNNVLKAEKALEKISGAVF